MILSGANVTIANELRAQIQNRTETVSDGEGVAMVLLWGFLADHARCHSVDIEKLARDQLESFIEYAKINISIVRQH
jgi:hypothetical protein